MTAGCISEHSFLTLKVSEYILTQTQISFNMDSQKTKRIDEGYTEIMTSDELIEYLLAENELLTQKINFLEHTEPLPTFH